MTDTLEIVYKTIDKNLGKLILGILFTCLIIGFAGAVPTTGAVTAIGSGNATLSATMGVSDGYFLWGQNPGNEYWRTPNLTVDGGGTFSYTIKKAPLFGNTLFYVVACDSTGCGNEVSFTTLPVTPIPTLHIGGLYQNMTENGYDLGMIGYNLILPYIWNGNMPLTVIFMLLFSPVFIGVWLQSRTVMVALILGFITGSFILFNNNSGLGISMPPEIVVLAQCICYVSFAGCVLYIIHR